MFKYLCLNHFLKTSVPAIFAFYKLPPIVGGALSLFCNNLDDFSQKTPSDIFRKLHHMTISLVHYHHFVIWKIFHKGAGVGNSVWYSGIVV